MFGKLHILFGFILMLLTGVNATAQIGPINDSSITTVPSNREVNRNTDAVKTTVKKRDQTTDSLSRLKHSPKKATLLSVCLPGAGQVYNKKYWKVSVIYVAAGAALYGALWNNKYYKDFKEQYSFRVANGFNEDPYYNQFQEPTLLSYRDYYHKNRDLSYILLGATYILQIVDAAVDAHFYDFKITEDLSLNVQPQLYWVSSQAQTHLLFTLKF